jgi:hypothetical protein
MDAAEIETTINRFLDFWEQHAREPDELRVLDWVITTPGCEGDFGCCAEGYDLSGLVDALYELSGRTVRPARKDLPDRYYVETRHRSDDKAEERLGPVPFGKAEALEAGIETEIDHQRFYLLVVHESMVQEDES